MKYIDLGPTPAEETCAQVGSDGYEARARLECAVFIRMLQRLFPIPQGLGVRYALRRYPHDFGAYWEVGVGYEDIGSAAEPSCEFAFSVERCVPDQWDPIARYELLWFERHGVRSSGSTPAEPPQLPAGSSLNDLLTDHPL